MILKSWLEEKPKRSRVGRTSDGVGHKKGKEIESAQSCNAVYCLYHVLRSCFSDRRVVVDISVRDDIYIETVQPAGQLRSTARRLRGSDSAMNTDVVLGRGSPVPTATAAVTVAQIRKSRGGGTDVRGTV
jgi:hypothetical protein